VNFSIPGSGTVGGQLLWTRWWTWSSY